MQSEKQNKSPARLSIIYLCVLLFALTSCYIALIGFLTKHKVYTDTALIYISSYVLNQGKNPYDLPDNLKILLHKKQLARAAEQEKTNTNKKGAVKQTTIANLSPPFATMLVSFFSRCMTEQQFSLSVKVFNILANLFALYLLANILFEKHKWRAYLSLVLLDFGFMATVYSFTFGEISLLFNSVLISSCVLYKNKKDKTAAIILAFAANIKLFFGLFFLLFLAQKRYKALASFVITGLVLALLPLFIYGLEPYLGYLKALSEVYWYPINWNASYLAILSRVFGDTANHFESLWHMPILTHGIYYFIFAVYVVFVYLFCRKLKHDALSSFALFTPCMLLLSPLGWYYYFPLLTLSFVHYFKKIQECDGYLYYLFFLLALLLVLNLPVGLQTRNTTTIGFQLGYGSYYFYCLFIFHLVQCCCYLKANNNLNLNSKLNQNLHLVSENMLALLFSVIFIFTTSIGLLDFVRHKPDSHPEIRFVNTPEQPFTIVVGSPRL